MGQKKYIKICLRKLELKRELGNESFHKFTRRKASAKRIPRYVNSRGGWSRPAMGISSAHIVALRLAVNTICYRCSCVFKKLCNNFLREEKYKFFFRKMCERFGEDVKRLISISRSSQSDDDVHREHPFDFNYRFVGEIKSAEKAHLSKCGYRRWKNLPREKWKLQIFPLYYTQPKNRRPQFRRQRCYSISRF